MLQDHFQVGSLGYHGSGVAIYQVFTFSRVQREDQAHDCLKHPGSQWIVFRELMKSFK